jgi:hypothetical protein
MKTKILTLIYTVLLKMQRRIDEKLERWIIKIESRFPQLTDECFNNLIRKITKKRKQ